MNLRHVLSIPSMISEGCATGKEKKTNNNSVFKYSVREGKSKGRQNIQKRRFFKYCTYLTKQRGKVAVKKSTVVTLYPLGETLQIFQ